MNRRPPAPSDPALGPSVELRAAIAAFLADHTTVTLATVSRDALPAAAALLYAHDKDLNLFFLSEERTQHGLNLTNSPVAAGTIQDDRQDWRNIRGLQLRGLTAPVPMEQLAHATAVYVRKYPFVGVSLLGTHGPGVLSGPLARARFYILRPYWFRLVDNTVEFGYKQELHLPENRHH